MPSSIASTIVNGFRTFAERFSCGFLALSVDSCLAPVPGAFLDSLFPKSRRSISEDVRCGEGREVYYFLKDSAVIRIDDLAG
jgi:hypothetical protein